MSFLGYCRGLGINGYEEVQSPLAWIAPDARVGTRTIISPGAWIGPGVAIGKDCYIGPNAVIGAPGFGYEWKDDEWRFREHEFSVVLGDRVTIGANTVVDRGRHRDTHIRSGTKIDAHCFLAHNVIVGRNCLVIANTMIAGSSEVGYECWIGPSVQISDHVKIGNRVRLGMGSVVLKDVPEGELWFGNPAKFQRMNTVTCHSEKVEA